MSQQAADRNMTKKAILDQCKRNKLYSTPALNDVLYLHFHGFPKIENLDEYTGLKCLWLESNAISKIEGVDHQPNLKSLFLQNNLISKIENLENCKELDTLVLSHNYIKSLENCCSEVLPVLNTLNISHNQLRDADSLEILKRCENISILDLSFNKIDDIMVVKVLGGMPLLHVLNFTGNPVIGSMTDYRKTMILECKSLTYLDSRPVFPRERACAEAWKRGGFAAEKREHDQWNREERHKIRRSVNSLLIKTRGESMLMSSSDDESDETSKVDSEPSVAEILSKHEEGSVEVYESNQKELIEMYQMEQKELDVMVDCAEDSAEVEQAPANRTTMIERMKEKEKIDQQKDEITKLLDISSDQDRILKMLHMNKNIEETIFGSGDATKKILIEEIADGPPIAVQENILFKRVQEAAMPDFEPFAAEMESMLWFEDDAPKERNEESLDYQFTNLPDFVVEPLVEDPPTGPESFTNPEDFEKVLELCQEQRKSAMQLCFLNENEKLMQIYDEAVEQRLVQESDGKQLAEIEEMCHEVKVEDDNGNYPNLDGILIVKKLDLSEEPDDDDEEVLQFSFVDVSNEVRETAESLINGVIESLEDFKIPM